jgi:ubiquinone biosynthesis protein UbiJ
MTAEAIAALRDEMRAGFAELRTELASVRGELANVREGLANVRGDLTGVRARVDGVPILGTAIETVRYDVRTLRAAINDMARINITAGEVEAFHADVDRMGTKQIELEARLSALEQGAV